MMAKEFFTELWHFYYGLIVLFLQSLKTMIKISLGVDCKVPDEVLGLLLISGGLTTLLVAICSPSTLVIKVIMLLVTAVVKFRGGADNIF